MGLVSLFKEFARGQENAQDQLNENFTTIEKSIEDTGWVELQLTSDWAPYSSASDTKPRIRRIGNLVKIGGLITPAVTIPGTQSTVTIATIPDEFIPKNTVLTAPTRVCQGSGRAIWNVSVNFSGKTLSFSRYRETHENAYREVTPGLWMPFDIDYFI